MIFNIDLISIYLWALCIHSFCLAINQIDNSVTLKLFTNKERAWAIFGNILEIDCIFSVYVGHYITATNVISLYYFVSLVVIFSCIQIILNLRHYENDVRKYSMCEIYFNMIGYMIIVFWMALLWVLKV